MVPEAACFSPQTEQMIKSSSAGISKILRHWGQKRASIREFLLPEKVRFYQGVKTSSSYSLMILEAATFGVHLRRFHRIIENYPLKNFSIHGQKNLMLEIAALLSKTKIDEKSSEITN